MLRVRPVLECLLQPGQEAKPLVSKGAQADGEEAT